MKLYHYEHCPFCVRVRMIIGWKNLDIEEEILANADEQRHYDLIGAKIVPILEKQDGTRIKESLDIVAYIDQNYDMPLLPSNTQSVNPSPALGSWLENVATPARHLVHPRNIRIFSMDFPSQKDKDYYEKKKSQSIGSFDTAFAQSATYIEAMKPLLNDLIAWLPPQNTKPSYDDIFLFPVLRSLSHVQGLMFPAEVYHYMERISQETKVPLLFEQAI